MKPKQIKQFYKEQLIKKGVDCQKAELAASNLTNLTTDELRIISEIWSEWGLIFQQLR